MSWADNFNAGEQLRTQADQTALYGLCACGAPRRLHAIDTDGGGKWIGLVCSAPGCEVEQ